MNKWFILLAVFFICVTLSTAMVSSDGLDNEPSYLMPFKGMEKKWSRREPSIRFFKRNGQQVLAPVRFQWDN